MNYEEQEDSYSKFYDNFDNIINEEIVQEIYNEKMVDVSDEWDWDINEDEYKSRKDWYDFNKEDTDFQVEEEVIEAIINKVFEDTNIVVNRLKADDYLDFGDYIKEKYLYLNTESN